jgi:hypothetical protein
MASMNPNPFLVPLQDFAPSAFAPTPPVATVTAPPLALPVEGMRLPSPPVSRDASGPSKDARLRMRRIQLTRFVKSVVLASLLLCVAALGRAAALTMTGDSVPDAAAPAVRAAQDLAPAAVHAEVDSLTDRTVRAMAHPLAAPKRSPTRATAARHKRR